MFWTAIIHALSIRKVHSVFVALSLAFAYIAVHAPPAYASHQAFAVIGGENVEGIPTFGANEVVEFIGGFDYYPACPPGGVNDPGSVIIARSDVHVVASGTTASLGPPNTVEAFGGLTLGDIVAITQPSGTLGSGTYGVFFDECQDGAFTPGIDALFDPAFRVEIPVDVPPIDPLVTRIKEQAHADGGLLESAMAAYEAYGISKRFLDIAACGPDGVCLFPIALGTVIAEYMALLRIPATITSPEEALIAQSKNLIKHYNGIAADPPDMLFREPTMLAAVERVDLASADPLDAAVVQVANSTATEAELARALLKSLERYQGADAAGSGNWALTHARDFARFARLLSEQLRQTTEALLAFDAVLGQDRRDFAEAARILQDFGNRVEEQGLTDDEHRELLNAGFSQLEITRFRSAAATAPLDIGLPGLRELLREEAAFNQTFATHLDRAALDAEALANRIVSALSVRSSYPAADAGRPYHALQGDVVTLDATGSTAYQGRTITAYEWDLDADGAFDDATGATPGVTFEESFDGLVGVRVTDSAGQQAAAYTTAAVEPVNEPPEIVDAAPTETLLTVAVDESREFSVRGVDPDGDDLTTTWFVDGVSAHRGSTFGYTAVPRSGPATDVVRAEVSDGESRAIVEWVVVVTQADADGDGYRANVDCDDAVGAVNPGAVEILDNGVDDDCDGQVDVGGAFGTVLGGRIFSGGGSVEVEVLPAEAGLTSELWLFEPAPEQRIATNRDIGAVVELGPFPEGVELLFGIRHGDEFRMGPGSRNPDGLPHAVVDLVEPSRIRVGFEDLFGGGDLDYNDNVFEFRGAVSPVDDAQAPTAAPDTFHTEQDTPLEFAVEQLLRNDTDPDGGRLEVLSVDTTSATAGSVALEDGVLVYEPPSSRLGEDVFTYTILDPQGGTATATVTVTIDAPNRQPLASNFVVTTANDVPIALTLSGDDPDGDSLVFEIVQRPAHGTLSPLRGTAVTYTPDADYVGPDVFTYRVADPEGATDVGTIGIDVTEAKSANSAPNAADLELETAEGRPLEITLDGIDPDGDRLSFEIVDSPTHGTLSPLQDRHVVYSPSPEYVGHDSFTYRVTDSHGAADLATVSIEVTAAPPSLDCTAASPSSDILWPPNHEFRPIEIVGIGNPGDAAVVTITGISQDEPVEDDGDGNTSPDGRGVGDNEAEVRSERSGRGDGRVYHVAFAATHPSRGSCTGEVVVAVPHSPNKLAVDSSSVFDSTAE